MLVAGGDIVFEQHGDAVHGAAHRARRAFIIQRLGDVQGFGVQFQHRIELVHIVALDALQVVDDQVRRRQLAAFHQRLQLGDGLAADQRFQRGGLFGRVGGQGFAEGGEIAYQFAVVIRFRSRVG